MIMAADRTSRQPSTGNLKFGRRPAASIGVQCGRSSRRARCGAISAQVSARHPEAAARKRPGGRRRGAGAVGAGRCPPPPTPTPRIPLVDINTTPPTLTPFTGDTGIEDLLDPASHVVVAGERLHEHLVRRFYAGHGWKTVWDGHPEAAAALAAAVLHAERQGLDPAAFHALALGRRGRALPPIEREWCCPTPFSPMPTRSPAARCRSSERMDDEDLNPEPVDLAAVLDNAINGPDPARSIEALAPNSPEYLALRAPCRLSRRRTPGGRRRRRVGRGRRRGSAPPRRCGCAQIAINLERLRWLPRNLPADRVWVKLPNAQLVLYRNNQPVFTTRVVVGEVDKQTPELQTEIDSPVCSTRRGTSRLRSRPRKSCQSSAGDPDYLADHHMVCAAQRRDPASARARTALGRLKFEMHDRFDVYLHDTPEKALFSRDNRRQSHGCVRVQNPRELAALLLRADRSRRSTRRSRVGYTNRRDAAAADSGFHGLPDRVRRMRTARSSSAPTSTARRRDLAAPASGASKHRWRKDESAKPTSRLKIRTKLLNPGDRKIATIGDYSAPSFCPIGVV